MADKINVLVICGATATGKTSLSIKLAKHFNGEIICADSMQIYKGLEIGTAQPTKQEQSEIPHHLVGFLPPNERFSVAQYVKCAHDSIAQIAAKGKLPIVVGGTGLYIESLVKGIAFQQHDFDEKIRQNLYKRLETQGAQALYNELLQIDETHAKTLHINQHSRIIRALEIYMQTGVKMSEHIENSVPKQRPYNDFIINLAFEQRQDLYINIEKRVDNMLIAGLLNEAKYVYDNRHDFTTAKGAIGYKEFFDYFESNADLPRCTAALKQATRRYAKRQITWFKRMGFSEQISPNEENDSLTAKIKTCFSYN